MFAEPKCSKRRCIHFIGLRTMDEELGDASDMMICKAFPDGIPYDIAYGDNPHDRILKGQFGSYIFQKEKTK